MGARVTELAQRVAAVCGTLAEEQNGKGPATPIYLLCDSSWNQYRVLCRALESLGLATIQETTITLTKKGMEVGLEVNKNIQKDKEK